MRERIVQEKLGKILINQKVITADQLKTALDAKERSGHPHKPVSAFLVELGMADESEITEALGVQFNIPVIRLKDVTVNPEVIRLVSGEYAHRFQICPVFLVGSELTVAVADPTRIEILDTLAGQTKCHIQPVLTSPGEMDAAIKSYYETESEGPSSRSISFHAIDLKEESHVRVDELRKAGKEVPIIKLVDQILGQAVEEGASDIHLEPSDKKLTVRYRIDGVLMESSVEEMAIHPAVTSRVKIISGLDIAERQKPQDGRISLRIGKKDLDIRVSTLPTVYGEKIVMRLLAHSESLLSLSDLGLATSNLEAFKKLIKQPYGIVLVTGPTGSGKSTTLYAALNAIKSVKTNIVTVEDPVEYQLPLLSQVQVNPKKDVTFANALRAILRQDPDIIMVGEIRDPETGNIATEAALTGHLVLSTLHTNDALGAAVRLIEMGVEPFVLGPALLGVMAQRLVRRICENCKELYTPDSAELERFGIAEIDRPQFARGKGCLICKQTGYKGRMGIHEVLVVDDAIRHMIATRASASEVMTYATRNGFSDMRFDGLRKIVAGQTTTEEVLMATKG